MQLTSIWLSSIDSMWIARISVGWSCGWSSPKEIHSVNTFVANGDYFHAIRCSIFDLFYFIPIVLIVDRSLSMHSIQIQKDYNIHFLVMSFIEPLIWFTIQIYIWINMWLKENTCAIIISLQSSSDALNFLPHFIQANKYTRRARVYFDSYWMKPVFPQAISMHLQWIFNVKSSNDRKMHTKNNIC